MIEKGIMTTAAIDRLAEIYENEVGPQLGAAVVAKAWTDPEFKARLLANATEACAEMGIGGLQGEDMVVVENTDTVHNVIICTLCSCYPWPVLGPAAELVQGPGVPRADRRASRGRCCARTSASTCRTRSRCGSGTPSSEMRYWVLPAAPGGHRRARREGAGRARHPRLDDRHRRAEGALMGYPAGRDRARRAAPRRGAGRRAAREAAERAPSRAVGAAGVRDGRGGLPRRAVRVERVPALAHRVDQEMGGRRRRRAVVVLRALAHRAGDRAGRQRRAVGRRPRRARPRRCWPRPPTGATTRPTASRWRSTRPGRLRRGLDRGVKNPLTRPEGSESLPGRAWPQPAPDAMVVLPRTRGL